MYLLRNECACIGISDKFERKGLRETYSFISDAEDVWVRGAICIVELCFGKCSTTFLIDHHDRFLLGHADLVWTISYERSIFFVQLGQCVRLFKRQKLAHLPQVGQRSDKRSRITCEWMKNSLIDDVPSEGCDNKKASNRYRVINKDVEESHDNHLVCSTNAHV